MVRLCSFVEVDRALPRIFRSNIRSLSNKMDELTPLMRRNGDFFLLHGDVALWTRQGNPHKKGV